MRHARRCARQRARLKVATVAMAAFMTVGGVMVLQAAGRQPVDADAIKATFTGAEWIDPDCGRLPGDDIPALTRCYMTAEEIQEDYENQKIEEALTVQGYLRDDIPLAKDLQAGLHAAADEAGIPFELAVAVVWQETDFRNVEGDGGDSVGYMQIQERWHHERMERLGVTDLTNPYQNFRVGCDYLAEMIEEFGTVEKGLIGYNTGETKARALFRDGVSSTKYSREVLEHYEALTEGVK